MFEVSFYFESAVAATVVAKVEGDIIAYLSIFDLDSESFVESLHVRPEWRRLGIATAMWRTALVHCPDLAHSCERTPAGDRWARSVTADLEPARILSPSACGYDAVVIDEPVLA